MRVIYHRLLEWWPSCNHDEKDHASTKNVSHVSFVRSSQKNFRSHIASRTAVGVLQARTILTLDRSSKAKISNFKIKLVIEHDVFRLEISMSNSLLVHMIKARYELAEEVSSDWFSKFSWNSYEVEQFSALS